MTHTLHCALLSLLVLLLLHYTVMAFSRSPRMSNLSIVEANAILDQRDRLHAAEKAAAASPQQRRSPSRSPEAKRAPRHEGGRAAQERLAAAAKAAEEARAAVKQAEEAAAAAEAEAGAAAYLAEAARMEGLASARKERAAGLSAAAVPPRQPQATRHADELPAAAVPSGSRPLEVPAHLLALVEHCQANPHDRSVRLVLHRGLREAFSLDEIQMLRDQGNKDLVAFSDALSDVLSDDDATPLDDFGLEALRDCEVEAQAEAEARAAAARLLQVAELVFTAGTCYLYTLGARS